MKITKYEHSCLLVEMPVPVNRTTLFDPGMMSEAALNVDELEYLDDIIITHGHGDHLSLKLMKALANKFPAVKITAPPDVVDQLEKEDISAASDSSQGIVIFEAPHETVEPLSTTPPNYGINYLDLLTHPGDSHSFDQTMPVLALPVSAPWGSTIEAINLALKLKPQYILPIHDWHWRTEARDQIYSGLEAIFAKNDITFVHLKTGEPVVLDL